MDKRLLPQTYEGKLDHIIEEASEVIKEAIKIRRFGPFSYHPDDPKREANIVRLQYEVIDLKDAVNNFAAHVYNEDLLKGRHIKFDHDKNSEE